ncbi:MAG: TlyA family RNA methyltransferase [Peptococcaceae bacterium]|nr:TlyA family RNA methyltransferase [Peptococcaceae bacterium]
MTAKENKERADLLLVEQGLAPSRERARALIMAGQVYLDTRRIEKAGQPVPREKKLEVKGQALPYVSRGGLKLEKALRMFPIELQERRVLDIGASTGGFTDCALQNGAREVIAVDVGYGQLDWKLRSHPQVKVMEKTNARYLTRQDIDGPVDFVTIDVSFISLDKILPVLPGLFSAAGQGVALIKPQFEAGREKVGKKGVVKDPGVHREVILRVLSELDRTGLQPYGLTFSPVRGPEGNIEYLLWFGRQEEQRLPGIVSDVDTVIGQAFQTLKGGNHDS